MKNQNNAEVEGVVEKNHVKKEKNQKDVKKDVKVKKEDVQRKDEEEEEELALHHHKEVGLHIHMALLFQVEQNHGQQDLYLYLKMPLLATIIITISRDYKCVKLFRNI